MSLIEAKAVWKRTDCSVTSLMISYLLVVEQHRTQIVIHALLKCQQENLYHEQIFFNNSATPEISSLSHHAAPPISLRLHSLSGHYDTPELSERDVILVLPDVRSEEHTSELQSQSNLVCRLLLEKKNQIAIHALLKCQHENLYTEHTVTQI